MVGLAGCEPGELHDRRPAAAVPPMAVLGNSDSHAYQDRIAFPPGSPDRGGSRREATLQWTEILGRLRGDELDPGPWGEWGTRGRLAQLRGWLGLPARAPRKEDYAYNFAWSGAGCGDLLSGRARQVPPLLDAIAADPARWAQGIVVIRIGINDLGTAGPMEDFAREGPSPAQRRRVAACTEAIAAAVARILGARPEIRIVLVGILDNADWGRFHGRWQSVQALANIAAVLDEYDAALRAIAAARPNVRFFDDRAFFRSRWGGRDAAGRPAYREVSLGPLRITNSLGDAPPHGFLADGHAGTVWNALWAQAFVALLRKDFGMPVRPIEDRELIDLIDTTRGPR